MVAATFYDSLRQYYLTLAKNIGKSNSGWNHLHDTGGFEYPSGICITRNGKIHALLLFGTETAPNFTPPYVWKGEDMLYKKYHLLNLANLIDQVAIHTSCSFLFYPSMHINSNAINIHILHATELRCSI